MNLRYNIIMLATLPVIAAACADAFDEHYNATSDIACEGSVYERLAKDAKYSKFAALVSETGMAEYLSGQDLVTVWAPSDETMPAAVLSMSDADKRLLVRNHISISTIYSRNVTASSSISTLAGKNLNAIKSGSRFTIDGVNVIESDQLYDNGLIHELDGWLVPHKNISQWLGSLSDDYSIYRDSLLAHNVRTFDKENSPILGLDESGTIVYDSVWVVSNDYLNNIDLADETGRFTLLVPDNEVIGKSLAKRRLYFESIGRKMAARDSLDMMDWIMKASVYRGSLSLSNEDIVKSVSGKEMRMSRQTLRDTIAMSNGRVYTFGDLYVPKDIHYSRLEFNPYYIRREIIDNGGVITANKVPYDKFYNGVNNTASKIIEKYPAVYWQFNSTSKNNYYQFEARYWDADSERTEDMMIMPGHYTLRMQFINEGDGFKTDVLDIYEVIKDDKGNESLLLINTIRGVTKKYYYTESSNKVNGVVIDDWEFTGNYGKRIFRVVIPGSYTDGTQRRICVGACTLIPNDNY